MKTLSEMRLECVRMAVSVCASKGIAPKDIIPYAMEMYCWVQNGPELASKDKVVELADKYGR